MPSLGAEPFGLAAPAAHRSALLAAANAAAGPVLANLGASPEGFLAADFPATPTAPRTCVFAFPLLMLDSDDPSLQDIAAYSGATWCSLDEAAASPWLPPAAAALAAIGSFRRASAGTLASPRHNVGARGLFALETTVPPSPTFDTAEWARLVAGGVHANEELAAALRDDGDPWLAEWADQIAPFDGDTVPEPLRQGQPFDARFAALGFPKPYDPPTSEWTPLAAPYCTAHRVRGLDDVVMEPRLSQLRAWSRECVQQLRTGVRTCSTFIIEQHDVFPEARGVVWDLRTRGPDGLFGPLDVTTPVTSAINGAWWAKMLEFYPHQAIVAAVVDGVQLKADVPLTAVLNPHLLSVIDGIKGVEAAHSRAVESGRFEEWHDLPFFPIWITAQGSVPRSNEPARPRPIADAGQPRKPVLRADGSPVVSINEASGASRRERLAALDAKAHVKWFPEVKPTVADSMRADAILNHAAVHVYGEPLFAFMDDEADSFMQFKLASSELWLSTILWGQFLDNADEAHLKFLAAKCMTYGYSPTSNIKQDVAWGVTAIACDLFDAEEAVLFTKETCPLRREYIAERAALSLVTGRNELRLYNLFIYTDDGRASVVGVDRTVRLLRCWRRVTTDFGLVMAPPAKRACGVTGTWIGVVHCSAPGVSVITQHKRLRMLAELREVCSSRQLPFSRWQSLVGRLQDSRAVLAAEGSCMYGLYAPHRARLGPDDLVHVSSLALERLTTWTEVLENCSGVAWSSILDEPQPARSAVAFSLFSDAAKADAPIPSLAGWFHGYWWSVSLAEAGLDFLHIPELELAAVGVNIITAYPLVGSAAAALYSDSLTSMDVIAAAAARAPCMQTIHALILELPEYVAMAPQLVCGHCFGEGNPCADLPSRGRFEELESLCNALGTTQERLPVPSAALEFLARVRERCLLDSRSHHGLGAEFSSCSLGDGPPSHVDPDAELSTQERLPVPAAALGFLARDRGQCLLDSRPHHGLGAEFSSCSLGDGPPSHVAHGSESSLLPADRGAGIVASLEAQARSAPRPLQRGTFTRPPPSSKESHNVLTLEVRRRGASLLRPVHELTGLRQSDDGRTFTRSLRARNSLAPATPRRPSDTADETVTAASPSHLDLHLDGAPALLALSDLLSAALDNGYAPATRQKDAGAVEKYWKPFCKLLKTHVWRDDAAANSGLDPVGHRREVHLILLFLVWIPTVMKPRSNASPEARPASARQVIDSVRREHRRCGHSLVKSTQVSLAVDGLKRLYIRRHGPESLQPARMEPYNDSVIAAVLNLPAGALVAGRTLDWSCFFFTNWLAALALTRWCGFRKAEVAHAPNSDAEDPLSAFEPTNNGLKFSSVVWRLRGVIYSVPPRQLLSDLQAGDAAGVSPSVAKNDQFKEVWGQFVIWLPFGSELGNAARQLRDLELLSRVPAAERARTPLLRADRTRPQEALTQAQFDTVHAALFQLALGPTRAKRYSGHSGRIELACRLLAAGASTEIIQALVRWRSAAAVRIYARMNDSAYMSWLQRAAAADVSSVQAANLPVIDLGGAIVALDVEPARD
jgi:hypothetical protein